MNLNTQLLQQLDNARARLNAVLETVNPQSELNPGITVKDMLAHIAAWDEVCVDSLRLLVAGEEPPVTVTQGIDAFNDKATTSYSDFGYEEVLQKLEMNRQQFTAIIDAMPEKMLTMEYTVPWGGLGTVSGIVKILSEHEEEHADEVENIQRRHK